MNRRNFLKLAGVGIAAPCLPVAKAAAVTETVAVFEMYHVGCNLKLVCLDGIVVAKSDNLGNAELVVNPMPFDEMFQLLGKPNPVKVVFDAKNWAFTPAEWAE